MADNPERQKAAEFAQATRLSNSTAEMNFARKIRTNTLSVSADRQRVSDSDHMEPRGVDKARDHLAPRAR
jgi:hypothetical protein